MMLSAPAPSPVRNGKPRSNSLQAGCTSVAGVDDRPPPNTAPACKPFLDRRRLLSASAVVLVVGEGASASALSSTLEVGPGRGVGSIAQALEQAGPGDTIVVYPGRYPERLVITKPVTLRAAERGAAEVRWETDRPYESTIECSADGATVSGLTIRHRSPSVANNYAVRLVGCDARLLGCDVSSSTGSAVGIEGGAPLLCACSLHDCKRNGAMIFGELEPGDEDSVAVVQDCVIAGNQLQGVVVRDGAAPSVTGNTIARNGGYGLALQGCGGRYEGNELRGNGAGAVAVSRLDESLDAAALARGNGLETSSVRRRAL